MWWHWNIIQLLKKIAEGKGLRLTITTYDFRFRAFVEFEIKMASLAENRASHVYFRITMTISVKSVIWRKQLAKTKYSHMSQLGIRQWRWP
jgi:hypothetical protein